jgi:hypothetical protein
MVTKFARLRRRIHIGIVGDEVEALPLPKAESKVQSRATVSNKGHRTLGLER